MKYDDASWHYGGNFPDDLPPAAGATHIGMFLAWALLRGFGGKVHTEESLEQLRQRTITPGQFLLKACGEKLTEADLSDEGNAFAKYYYKAGDRWGEYLNDYGDILRRKEPSLYHIPDTWETYDRIGPLIQQRFEEWKERA